MDTELTIPAKASVRERPRIQTTLLDLLNVVNQVTRDNKLVLATAVHLVNSGNARLIDKRLIIG